MKENIIAVSIVAVFLIAGTLVLVTHKSKIVEEDTNPTTAETTTLPVTSEETKIMDTQNQPENTTTETKTTTTASGLKITVLKEGTGESAKEGNSVSVNYTGKLLDGTVFDSNVDPKFGHVEPFTFTLGQHLVIAGWEEGVLGMKVGEKRALIIPASIAYGANGAGNIIPPNATLSFDVEVTAIK